MKFNTVEQLYDRLKEKRVLLAEDPDVIRQIRASREDRKAGRTYTGEEGLEFLRQQIREFERERQSNL